MTVDDLNEVQEIEKRSFVFPWSNNSFYGEIRENDYADYVVARLQGNGRIIGYGGLWVFFDEGHITTLAVHPLYRRAGAGSLLLDYLLKKAESKGARKVLLEVRNSNQAAHRLYKKYDFRVIGRRKNYYLNEDALVMVRAYPPLSKT
jgi:ribosomal-protein-alanine N-acetyltransferase